MNILTWHAPSNNGAFQKLTEFGYFSDMLTTKPTFSFEFTSMSYNEQNGDFSIDGATMSDEQKLEVLGEINAFNVPFEWVVNLKDMQLRQAYTQAIRTVVKEDGLEIASWDKQESEARAWTMDSTTSTPLIDALLVGRNLGESKEEFINKIITKADAYKVFYGQILGKLHAKQKELEVSKTIEAIKAIVW